MEPPPEGSSLPRPIAPLGEAELERALAAARAGDAEARRRVVQSHLRLVWAAVNRFRHRGEDVEDLFQVGCLGLVKAVDRFDPAYGTRFSTYAVPLVVGEIKRFLRDSGPVRVSRRLRELAAAARRTGEELAKARGREPSAAEVAAVLGVEAADVAESLEASRRPLSLQRVTEGEEGRDSPPLLDRLAAGTEAAAASSVRPAPRAADEADLVASLDLERALDRLDERTRRLLALRFIAEKTQAEVGKILGVSQVQVSRLERRALLELRAMLRTD